MSSDAGPDQYASAGDYVQRAALLADLGRYDEAAAELGYAITLDPGSRPAHTMLARVRLAAGDPDVALTAADAALAAGGGPDALVLRAFALIDMRRFAEAAQVADRLLSDGPADAYAQRSAAAILAEARNGQPALNAAWRGVELAPEESQAHLVLALVAARLELFDLAERGYAEALRLDPDLADARRDPGVVHLERRRYAAVLEAVAESAATEAPWRDPARISPFGVYRLVLIGAAYSIVAAVLAAYLAAAGSEGASRLWAGVTALVGMALIWRYATRIPGFTGTVLPVLAREDRAFALAVYAVLAAPVLILLYALIGTPWPLVLAIVATAVAEIAVFRRRWF